jgi:hypothetical protein
MPVRPDRAVSQQSAVDGERGRRSESREPLRRRRRATVSPTPSADEAPNKKRRP